MNLIFKLQPFHYISLYNSILNGKHQLLVYADDINMLGENLQTVRENTEILIKASQGHWFRGKFEKTEHRITSCQENIVQNENIVIENLEKFKYLGITITNTNDIWEESKCRINIGNACCFSLEKIS